VRLIPAMLVALAVGPCSALAQQPVVATRLVAEGLDRPLFLTAPSGDPRLFVVEQTGKIRILLGGRLLDRPFLDIGDRVSDGNEQGLLGLAFHPDYATNGRFFVNYTDLAGDTRIVAYTVSADANVANAASATPLLGVDQPYANHNGGWLGFGPDGYLYIGMGDGGAGSDPQDRAQDTSELLGKILRIDVDGHAPYAIPPGNPFAMGGGRPEIFAVGVRNPWRIAFDGHDIYIADVGQNAVEEIDVIATEDAGANLGWSITEGDACFRTPGCDATGFVAPVHEYTHDEGRCSVTGGYVYRGKAIPGLAGQYLFVDLCEGKLRSFAYAGGKAGTVTDWTDQLGVIGAITSFGEDSAGEIYITTLEGNLLQLVPGQ